MCCISEDKEKREMSMHPKLDGNYWVANSTTERNGCKCSKCPLSVDGLEFCNAVFPRDETKKTFIFYHFSTSKITTTSLVFGLVY